jgi:hypothetical protein
MQQFLFRVIGAATLDARVYEDVESDPRATIQAVGVIVLGSLAAGFGANGWNAKPGPILAYSATVGVLGLLAWAAWAAVTLAIGRQLREPQTRVDLAQLLRTIGFSAAPALFLVLAALGATTAVFAITAACMLATMVMAVRQALDYSSTTRAVTVCVLGWLVTALFVIVFSLTMAPQPGGVGR